MDLFTLELVKCIPIGKFLMAFYLVHPYLLMNYFNWEREFFQMEEDLSCNNNGRFQYRDWACLCSNSMLCVPKLYGSKGTGDSHTLDTSDIYIVLDPLQILFPLFSNNLWVDNSRIHIPSPAPLQLQSSAWQVCFHAQAMPLPQDGIHRHLWHRGLCFTGLYIFCYG